MNRHYFIAAVGNFAAFVLENYNHVASGAAATFTALWMARQIWLSFKRPKK